MAEEQNSNADGDMDQKPRRESDFYQYVAAGIAVALLAFLAGWSIWPFHEEPPGRGGDPSIWEVLLYDRVILGFLRAGIVAVVTYVIASVFALVTARRWMKGLGTGGLTADEAGESEDVIADLRQYKSELEAENEALLIELDEAYHKTDLFVDDDKE